MKKQLIPKNQLGGSIARLAQPTNNKGSWGNRGPGNEGQSFIENALYTIGDLGGLLTVGDKLLHPEKYEAKTDYGTPAEIDGKTVYPLYAPEQEQIGYPTLIPGLKGVPTKELTEFFKTQWGPAYNSLASTKSRLLKLGRPQDLTASKPYIAFQKLNEQLKQMVTEANRNFKTVLLKGRKNAHQIKPKGIGSMELFQRTPTTQQNTWTKPFQTNMGEIDIKTSTISVNNFGKLLGEGSEQSVYLHPTDPSKVLKVYSDIGHTSLNDLRKFVKQYQTRNNVPFQLETKFQGYVTDKSGKMYPVFSQQKVNNVLPNDSKNWVSNITPRLNKQMETIGYTNSHGNYIRGNRILTDVNPANITELPNGEFRFIDIFPEGFRKGGKICKIN